MLWRSRVNDRVSCSVLWNDIRFIKYNILGYNIKKIRVQISFLIRKLLAFKDDISSHVRNYQRCASTGQVTVQHITWLVTQGGTLTLARLARAKENVKGQRWIKSTCPAIRDKIALKVLLHDFAQLFLSTGKPNSNLLAPMTDQI